MTVENSLYPIFMQLHGKKVLVVGGGSVAERKVRALLTTGAHVHVGAPELTTALKELAGTGAVQWLQGSFEPLWLDGAWLVIAATDDRHVNAGISEQATAQHIWINVVDDPELSAFQVPAVVDRSPITIAISSGGHAPVLARRLRERLETLVGHSIGKLAGLLAQRRSAIRDAYPDLAQRRRFYDWTLDGPVLSFVDKGATETAAALIDQALKSPQDWPRKQLTLLHAPAADPGDLTLKGLRALHQADAIVFDPQRHDEAILGMARRDAERLPVKLDAWLADIAADGKLDDVLHMHGRIVVLADSQLARDAQLWEGLFARLILLEIPVDRI